MSIVATIRLLAPAGVAKPAPNIGQALGSLGVNMAKFCQEFNARTGQYTNGIPCRVFLTARSDGSFFFHTRLPRTSWFILNASKLEKGGAFPGFETIGAIHVKQIYHIALVKQRDSELLQKTPLQSICRSIIGQCSSMGVRIVGDRDVLNTDEDAPA
eukprot:gb/GEZN01021089.1/.p1 GENE.gb/GEZN01021089.1/~~gb/GEZN01021089.1/.p1  ORF type:complete len:157 (-),score=11.11 gb/GEZN01021089.1/:57-527(-)